MTEAIYQGRTPSSPSSSIATRKRSDNVDLIKLKMPPSTSTSSSSSSSTSASPPSSLLAPSAEAASRGKFSLFGARRHKRAASCAVVMGSSPGAPSPGAALLASSPAGGGGAEEWEEFQKRYRLLGIDDGGIDARPNETKESKKEKEKKAGTSRTPRLSKGRTHADLLHDTCSSTSTSSSTSDATKKEKEKKEKKEKKSAKRESKKEAKKEKKEKRRSRIVRRESTDVGTESACSSGSECEDGEGAGSTIIIGSSSSGSSDKAKKASSGAAGEKRGLGHRVRMSMRLGSREDVHSTTAATATAGPSSPPPTEHGSLRLPLSARRGVNPLLLGSFPHRATNMDRAVSDEVESGPLTAGRKRLASSPARVQVGRWERRTFHSGEMGGNDAVLSQLLKMAENIKKGQTGEGGAEDFCAGYAEGHGAEAEDFAGQEEEVRRVVREEQLRRVEEAIERERAKLRKLEARIRRAEKKLQRRKRASSAPTTPSSLLTRSGRLGPSS